MPCVVIVKATDDCQAGVISDGQLLTTMGKFNEALLVHDRSLSLNLPNPLWGGFGGVQDIRAGGGTDRQPP